MTGVETTLRPATREDAAYILRLEDAGMRSYAKKLWGAWKPSATPETLALAGHEVIRAAGRDAGCIACSWHPDHLRIHKLYVAPACRGQGIGASALACKLRDAAAKRLPVRLTVLATNPEAARFYAREGLCEIARDAERIMFEYRPAPHPGLE
ncbi:GNAT family N-acetyltransferase [Palleronia abyssalis]|uniref:N-acetyltransferase domain-containing protein n=1 Tax=Palleronia abyssalis TaxID=1501240 RepID=A0A2R8BVM9_9RHOB|nr:GNAT family N-acetyltransferase [Palleronia abyssalis]SPJ24185.1 hypothetical protein PAA8504_02013 [Palleronia abyssalis]